MPKLYEITDAYTPEETIDSLPVEQALPTERPRVIINTADFDKPKPDPLWDDVEGFKKTVKNTASGIADAIKYASELDQKFTSNILNLPKRAYEKSDDLMKGLKNLIGAGEEERYQLWPEKVAREALTSAGDIAKPNPYPEGSEEWHWYEGKRQEGMVPAAMAISALAGSGGLAGTGAKAGEVALGATPFLRPALKYKEKLYKGKPGQEHQDIIPNELYQDFQRKAMSGEDLAEYNFGFINDKGHFLKREDALKYGIDTGLIDPHSGRFGALTTTLMADSSKPGVAIEALAKTGGADPRHFQSVEAAKFRLGQLQRDKAATKKAGGNVEDQGYASYNAQIRALKSYIKNPELFADSSKEAAALQANKPAFYSAVEHTVKNIPQSKMTGDQWLGTLANKPGVKGEELDWTGLKDFLQENKGKPVTKAQIEEHIAANKVELKEVNKGGITERDRVVPDQIAQDKYKAEWDAKVAELRPLREKVDDLERKLSPQEWEKAKNDYFFKSQELDAIHDRMVNETVERMGGLNKPTKYHSYQLPGGENYREMLLTLPKENALAKLENEYKSILDEWKKNKNISPEKQARWDTIEAEIGAARKRGENINEGNYKSSHWDEPNILAHVRMNDRNIDGKKSLHLEEIQSDWHQQGRDRGYKQKYKIDELKMAGTEEMTDPQRFWYVKAPDNTFQIPKVKAPTFEDAKKYIVNEKNKGGGDIPDAPFKKTWHELALKRMIREAAEKGYDRLSWTPGEAQAARYDLSKQLKELQYLKNDDGTYQIAGVTKEGGGFNHPDNIPANKLPDVVGKEMAEKIIKNEGRRDRGQPTNGGYFSGVDLKIGGEGMKGFYDQIIPKSLEKLGKEHGVKVKKGKINNLDEDALYKKYEAEGYDAGEVERLVAKDMLKKGGGNQEIFYIDIPQSLKDVSLRKGFPLFSSTPGYMFVPFDGDPFAGNNK